VKAACPQCGADVEFRFDDTFVRVCDHCKAAVVRTDRGLETLGAFADLAETNSPLALLATGSWKGAPFELIGRAQLKHAAGGSWDEWYARFDDGRMGWLAEAQGRFYLMFAWDTAFDAPAYDSLRAGEHVSIPHEPEMTVSEVGEATYVAAAGEIPFRLAPGTKYRFADLSGAAGVFATLDYSDTKPALYLGDAAALTELHIKGGATPPKAPEIRASRLACPVCDGSIELRAPDATMRVGCPNCNALLDVSEGTLSVLSKLGDIDVADKPTIPLGTSGAFEGAQLTVIGWMRRHASVDGVRYPFEEYLLYEASLGFRWLVYSDGSWSYVRPVDAGLVEDYYAGVEYDGVKFRRFQSAPLVVERVVGEMYWKVELDERVDSIDYIAPPAMLSREGTDAEINWSLGEYRKRADIERALGGVELPYQVHEHAPNRPKLLRGMWIALGVVAAGLLIGSCIVSVHGSGNAAVHFNCDSTSTPPPPANPGDVYPPGSAVCFSEPFHLDGDENIVLELSGSADNSWISVGGDIVNDATGDVETFDRDIEYYRGYEDGESWSEGGNNERVFLDAMPEGTYVARIELQSDKPAYSVGVTVEQGVFHMWPWLLLLGLVLVPGLGLAGIAAWREKLRWQEASP
jgi:hypothetical protein